jgi:hypothetical protein
MNKTNKNSITSKKTQKTCDCLHIFINVENIKGTEIENLITFLREVSDLNFPIPSIIRNKANLNILNN